MLPPHGILEGFFPCERYLGKQCEQQQQEKKGQDQKIGQRVFTIRLKDYILLVLGPLFFAKN